MTMMRPVPRVGADAELEPVQVVVVAVGAHAALGLNPLVVCGRGSAGFDGFTLQPLRVNVLCYRCQQFQVFLIPERVDDRSDGLLEGIQVGAFGEPEAVVDFWCS
ncbi:hypothetical protein [Arthrobacter sp. B1I2]|uniref:hypothetical protein n=1 Tax=Arthrobacter sp. B1I2 TaxID=3042263 RepID=UPI0027870110|nr:hypothetical protein [Arthrobacter sp. B1I2]MDQ0732186.1 hypothetical protein [Arthrobacter sp. B1I2]